MGLLALVRIVLYNFRNGPMKIDRSYCVNWLKTSSAQSHCKCVAFMDSLAPFTMESRNCMSLKWGLFVLLGHWLWEWAVTEWRWRNCWTEEVHGTSYSECDCVSWSGVKRQCDNCHLLTICATTNSHTITVHFVHYNNYAFVTVHAQWTMDDGHAKDATHSSTSVLTFWSTRMQ